MRFLTTFILVFIVTVVSAQRISEAEAFFNEGNYQDASIIYAQALKKKPKDAALNFKYARCVYEQGQVVDAITYFENAVTYGFAKANCFLGDIYFNDYRFQEAAIAYNNWLESDKITAEEKINVAKLAAKAKLGAEMLERIEDIGVIDSLIVEKADFVQSIKIAREMGSFSLSSDLFGLKSDDYLVAFQSGRNDRRYLALRQEGTQSDLYQSYNLMNEWSEPIELSSTLNTLKNENFPFVAADGITIYFGSEGHEGLGGYDIFTSRFNSEMNDYLSPQNVGMPFNSPYNDYMMAFDDLAGVGWFVTDRYQNPDSVIIYRFVPNAERSILRNKTPQELRDAARMFHYRRVVVDAQTIYRQEATQKQSKETVFIVNDTTIYTSVQQFVSDEARQQFLSLCDLEAQGAQKQFTLGAKRELWGITELEQERQLLANEILMLEKSCLIIEGQIQRYENETRTLENLKLLLNQ